VLLIFGRSEQDLDICMRLNNWLKRQLSRTRKGRYKTDFFIHLRIFRLFSLFLNKIIVQLLDELESGAFDSCWKYEKLKGTRWAESSRQFPRLSSAKTLILVQISFLLPRPETSSRSKHKNRPQTRAQFSQARTPCYFNLLVVLCQNVW